MNYTENYQLSLWDMNDAVKMNDFNSDHQKIDAAIKAVADSGLKVATGSYIGNGVTTRTIDLPFAPQIMLLASDLYGKMIGILTSQFFAYAGGDSADVMAAGSSQYMPYLDGAALHIRANDWCNSNGKTTYYILIG